CSILDTDSKIDPRSFAFKYNKFRKPEILWPSDDTVELPLRFNISHTSSLIACGIAMDANIGIDIEEKKRKTTKSILSLARRFSPLRKLIISLRFLIRMLRKRNSSNYGLLKKHM
uniref:holo-[acyl-carrier-protein] synthase n=1 Tax=Aegilops tauschii subsp. strangulata TaxID=200361 RepID=A0A453R521_AEGTS